MDGAIRINVFRTALKVSIYVILSFLVFVIAFFVCDFRISPTHSSFGINSPKTKLLLFDESNRFLRKIMQKECYGKTEETAQNNRHQNQKVFHSIK